MSDFVRDDRSHGKRGSDASRARELRDLVVEEIDRPPQSRPGATAAPIRNFSVRWDAVLSLSWMINWTA